MTFPGRIVSLLSSAVLLMSAPAPAPPSSAPAGGAVAAASAPVSAADAAKPAASASAAAPKRGGTLRVIVDAEFTTMDPHASTSATDRQVYQSIFNTLVRLD